MTVKDELKRIRIALGKVLFNFAEVTSLEGFVFVYEGDLVEGIDIFTYDDAGERITAPDGVFTLEDGTVITIEGGMVKTIAAPASEEEAAPIVEEEKQQEMATDNHKEAIDAINQKIEELAKQLHNMASVVAKFSTVEVTEAKGTMQVDDKGKPEKGIKQLKYF